MEELDIKETRMQINSQLGELFRLAEQGQKAVIMNDAVFQERKHREILSEIPIDSRSVHIYEVKAWTGKTLAYLRNNLRSRKTNIKHEERQTQYWAIDVIRFLCDLWGIDYPERYIKQCKKEGVNPKTGDYA